MAYSGIGGSGGDRTQLSEAVLDVYSLDILHSAQGIMRYEEFAVLRTDLKAAPGQTVQFTTYANLTRGAELTEGSALSTNAMSASQQSITVSEYGNAISVSEKLLQASYDDLLGEAALLLGRDYAVVRDLAIRDAIVASGSTLFTSTGASAIADVLDDDKLDIETLRVGVEQLQTSNAPKFMSDFYVCFVHPHQAAYLKRDPDWVSAHQYAGSRNLFNGEIGRWEDVVFITTTHQGNGAAGVNAPGYEGALAATGAGGQDLFRATLMADQAFALADGLPVELRDNGVEDFGRMHSLAWYGIWGQGVLNSDHLIHMISS
jgi:N4-gp56 family major capsid protein